MKICSNCQCEIKDSDTVCPVCGTRQQSEGVPTVPAQTEAISEQAIIPEPSEPSPAPQAKHRKLMILLILISVVVLGGIIAWIAIGNPKPAALTVDQFYFSQRAFFVGSGRVETQVLAVLSAEQDTAGVTLLAVNGKTGETVRMTDDGQGADTIAGDGAFYGSVYFDPVMEERIPWRLKTEGDQFILQEAPTAEVVFCTEAAVAEERTRNRDILAELDLLAAPYHKLTGFDENSYIQVLREMQQYLDGLKSSGDILSWEYSFPDFLVYRPVGCFVYSFDAHIEGYLIGLAPPSRPATVYEYDLPYESDSHDMVLLDPYHMTFTDIQRWLNNLDGIEKALGKIADSDLGYPETTVYRNLSAAANIFQSLSNYRVIVIYTHGNCFEGVGTVLGINRSSSDFSDSEYANWLYLDGSTACLTARFFEHYYRDGEMNDPLIYLAACCSAQQDDLVKVLLRKGARTVMGFDQTVSGNYENSLFERLVEALIQNDPEAPGMTKSAEDAFIYAKEKAGDHDTLIPGYMETIGNFFGGKPKLVMPARPVIYTSYDMEPFRLVGYKKGILTTKVMSIKDNSPIKKATIEITDRFGKRQSMWTNQNGTCRRSLPPGKYTIRVTAPGFNEARFTYELRRDNGKELWIYLEQTGDILIEPPPAQDITTGENGDWQSAYLEFLTSGAYQGDLHFAGPIEWPEYTVLEEDYLNRDTSWDSATVWDMDGNGIPELLIATNAVVEQIDVFTWNGSYPVHLGVIGGDNFFQWVVPSDPAGYPGIVTLMGGPAMDLDLYTVEANTLVHCPLGSTMVNDTGDGTVGMRRDENAEPAISDLLYRELVLGESNLVPLNWYNFPRAEGLEELKQDMQKYLISE